MPTKKASKVLMVKTTKIEPDKQLMVKTTKIGEPEPKPRLVKVFQKVDKNGKPINKKYGGSVGKSKKK